VTDVAIVGLGLHPFGRTPGVSGRRQGLYAARAALADAGADWSDMQFGFGGSRDAGNANSLVAELGLTGVPFTNVYNGCATGGASLALAVDCIRAGRADVGLVVGFDAHPPGAFDPDPTAYGLGPWYGETGLMLTTQFFALKIQRYMHAYDIRPETLATVAAKAFANGAANPNAWRRTPLTPKEILASTMVSHPLTKYMFCTPGEGGAALVLCRADLAHHYTSRPVLLRAAELRSRRYGSFEVFSPWLSVEGGDSVSSDAASAAFAVAGIGPGDIGIAELQDTDAGAEIMHMAEVGLCAHGDQEKLIHDGATRIGGSLPVNTDGGCIANGEPIGASGLRQVYEVALQLRGDGGSRQIPTRPKTGFTHVYGAPGISVCTVLTV